MYDSRDLTTHAVCVGMTGSGKTGLCISLLEEAALDGIPALVIDPKGDIANLMLTFPGLSAAEFQPWIDAAEAGAQGHDGRRRSRRRPPRPGRTASPNGARTATASAASANPPTSRSTRRAAPPGLPLSILRSFAPPPEGSDAGATRDRISAAVAGLLGLVGIAADPLKSREHILLSAIVDAAWSQRQRARPRGPDRRDPEAAVRQGRRVRRRDLLSRPRTGSSSRWRSTTCSPRPASASGSRARRSTSSACCSRPRASRASPSSRLRISTMPSACSS